MSLNKHYDDMYQTQVHKQKDVLLCEGWPVNRLQFAICNASGGEVVCDVGCGDGSVLYSLKEKYSKFIGFDVSEKRLEIAKNNCNDLEAEFFNKKFDEETDLSNESVDTVLCLDVLDHMIDVRKAIENFYTVLKPKGKLILNVPNIARIDQRCRLLFGKFPSTSTKNEGVDRLGNSSLLDGGKLHYFTFSSMIALLTEVGFEKIEKYGIGKYKKVHNIYPELLSGSISLVCTK